MSLDSTGRVVITPADVQVALDETDDQAAWMVHGPDGEGDPTHAGMAFTERITDVGPFRAPAWPRYLTTCKAVRNGVARDGLDKTARFFTNIILKGGG